VIFLVYHDLGKDIGRRLVELVEIVLLCRRFLGKGQTVVWQGRPEVRTSTVARFGLTVFILPSLPTMASHIWSHGGVLSSSTTINRGLSHLVMPLGSSYRKIRFSKSSSSYPPSFSLSASSFLLFSRHRSAGVPMCSLKTVSLVAPRTDVVH